ncbi:MAG: thioredoxin family protein [Thermoplasmata archaeon]
MGRGHTIEIFSAGCPLCTYVSDVIEVGKCKGCTQVVLDVNQPKEETRVKMREYGVTAVPTIIIDGEVKITGVPPFPWVCDDDLYRRLRKEYPLPGTKRSPN